MSPKPTPRPWKQDRDDPTIIVGPGPLLHKTICGMYGDDPVDTANAKHIVRCVNAFDDLLAASVQAGDTLSIAAEVVDELHHPGAVTFRECVKLINTAIAKAQKKGRTA